MLTRIKTLIPAGTGARALEVTVDVWNGPSGFKVLGLPHERAATDLRGRVRSALQAFGFSVPPRAITVTVEPAALDGNLEHLDLPVALALLASLGRLPDTALVGPICCGELGLNGSLRPVRGTLAVAEAAEPIGARQLLVPAANAGEAAAAGIAVIPVRTLVEAVGHLLEEVPLTRAAKAPFTPATSSPDLAQVRGQEAAKRALEVATAGGHHVLLIGPPVSGKALLARCLPGILPPLVLAEAIEVTKIHSLAAAEPLAGLVSVRPFRSPHPGLSVAALLGGGPGPIPGEASLAHAGVLFLDDLPDFRRNVLEGLRQALDEGRVTLAWNRERFRFPARVSLVAAMSGCPCGHLGDRTRECRCPRPLIQRYRSRILEPLAGHIDVHVEMEALSKLELRSPAASEPSSAVAARVLAARQLQSRRYADAGPKALNASVHPEELSRHCELTPDARRLLEVATERLALSDHRRGRTLAVARTIADLDAGDVLAAQHVAEAIQYQAPAARASRASS
jgi:magnesium chelatase family protein